MSTFFDLLPEDVMRRLGKAILEHSCFCNALSLAEITTREGLFQAMGHKVVLDVVHQHRALVWLELFRADIHDLDLCYRHFHGKVSTRIPCLNYGYMHRQDQMNYFRRLPELPMNLLPLPNLRSASIQGWTHHLTFVKNSPNLRRLHIEMFYDTDWSLLLDALSSLTLEFLHLRCAEQDPYSTCLLSKNKENLPALAESCSDLKQLEMGCYYDNSNEHWPFIHHLRSLEVLIPWFEIQENDIEFLRGLKEVELVLETPLTKAAKLGKCLTVVFQLDYNVLDDVRLLQECPHLREVCLRIADGAEVGLVGKFNNIEVLDLSWENRNTLHVRDYKKYFTEPAPEPTNYQPDAGLLLKLVENAGGMRELHFRNAVVSVDVVEKMLKMCGKKLMHFGLPYIAQGETGKGRVTRIMKAVEKWCPRAQRFHTRCGISFAYMQEIQETIGLIRMKVARGERWYRFMEWHRILKNFNERISSECQEKVAL